MKKIALKFTYYTDLVAVSDGIFHDIHAIRLNFDKWLYDKTNEHGYWVCVDGKKKAVSFDTTAFIHFLNDVYMPKGEQKAIVLQHKVESIPSDVPLLFF